MVNESYNYNTEFTIKPIFQNKPTSCETSKISKFKKYLVKIDNDWFIGYFGREWYGWNFDNWGTSGIQLDEIDKVYEFYAKDL